METQTAHLRRALEILSYSLLAAGILLFSPFLLLLLVKIAPIGPIPVSFLGYLLGAGTWAIFMAFLTIPGSGVWLQRKGDHADTVRFYKTSFIRYAPVPILGIIQIIYSARYDAFHITALYALGLIVYAGWLLRRDRILT